MQSEPPGAGQVLARQEAESNDVRSRHVQWPTMQMQSQATQTGELINDKNHLCDQS